MKNLYLKAFVLLLLAGSCSAPKYSYYFSHNRVPVAKQKISTQQNSVTTTDDTQLPSALATVPVPASEELVLASAGKDLTTVPAVITSPAAGTKAFHPLSGKKLKMVKSQMKAAIKSYRHDSKKISPDSAEAAGNQNQLVALLLAIFLGGLGIHRFYLGRIWTGVLQVVLALTSFLLFPLYILAIWVLIDIILIAMGTLGPKDGSYGKTL
jgi:TM2 domain-containing membrane protein YozV